jgi:UDP-N-acetylmuramyl tripeptide synthase
MDLLAVWLGKLTVLGLRITGRRGTALPGLLVEKVFPGYLPRQLGRLEHGVILVSGTNGKTTTTKMLATVLGRDHRVLTNATGGNFVRGTITATVLAASWTGRLAADVAVFELDEAHAVRFCAVHAPRRALLLNVLRDQLDRFGEIDTTAKLLGSVAAMVTEQVVLNRDDPRLVALAPGLTAKVSYFGVTPSLAYLFPSDDQLYDECGPTADPPALAASAELLSIDLSNAAGGIQAQMRLEDTVVEVGLRTDGVHNGQNAVAAAAMALATGMSAPAIVDGLQTVEPAFGRGQSFHIQGRRVVLQLVKNPAGFRLSLRTVAALKPAVTVIAINDDYADGRDMSWLWDVDFAAALRPSATTGSGGSKLVTSGTRAFDMALRLQYDDLAADAVQPNLSRAVTEAVEAVAPDDTVVVFATYTAMWHLHRVLERTGATEC